MTKQKDKGSAFEKRVVRMAQEHGLEAHKQPGSGIYSEYPSDAVIENILIECKAGYTRISPAGERFFRLDMNWIAKNEAHAKRVGLRAAVLGFRPNGSHRVFALVDMDFFLSILKESMQ